MVVTEAEVEGKEAINSKIDSFTHLTYIEELGSISSRLSLPDFKVPLSAFEHLPVGDRMYVAAPNWEAIGAHPTAVSILKNGYSLEFNSLPPLVVNPAPFYLHLSTEQQLILDDEMFKFLDGHVIEPVLDLNSPGFYSPLFLRPKTDKGWRIIINISELNKHLVYKRFRMETINTVRQSLKQGMVAFTLDLKSAYSHIPIHPASRKYLRFFWHGRAFQFRSLPFGIAVAPQLFSFMVSQVARHFHRHGVPSHFYLDDWQFFEFLRHLLAANQPVILLTIRLLGWILNLDKSDLEIQPRSVYIGGDFRLDLGLVFPTQKRWDKVQSLLPAFCSLSSARASLWASVLGVLTSLQDLTPIGRLQLRLLQYHVNQYWTDREDLNILIPLTDECKSFLRWWLDPQNVMQGVPFVTPPAQLTIFTDSSNEGFGASLDAQHFSGKWSPSEKDSHINFLEMLCVKYALQHFQQQVAGKSILIASDNSTVISYLNKQSGTRSWSLHQLTYSILLWCFTHQVVLKARHIPGRLNIIADQLSRSGKILQTEWMLHSDVFRAICMVWHTPNIDLFATQYTNKLPTYFSPVPDPQCLGVDALSQSWEGVLGYAFPPPPSLIPLVLNKIEAHKHCTVILITPKWERKGWFVQLLGLLTDLPRQIPVFKKLLKQPNKLIFHSDPQTLQLHACLLSSNTSSTRAFRSQLQRKWPTRPDLPPTPCMRAIGQDTLFGVFQGILIHSLPLYL